LRSRLIHAGLQFILGPVPPTESVAQIETDRQLLPGKVLLPLSPSTLAVR
jgi:hypothetical protein